MKMAANSMHKVPPLYGASLALLTLAVGLVTFMQVLDTTIANVAVPTIAGNLGASNTQGTWIITSFAVANAISVPLTGCLAKRIGEVTLFLWAIALFVLMSWLCGLSPNMESLILFRVLQGFVAGPMIPLSQSILLANYPPEKKTLALALWSMVIVVAPIFGPILGGWISDDYHWSWIFYINIPIGAFAFLLCWRLLKGRETEKQSRPIDLIGLGLLFAGVGCLQLVLDRGRELDWFASNEIVLLSIVAGVSLVLLIIWELYEDNPIIDIRLFKNRNFAVGVGVISLGFMVYFGLVLLLPLLLQSTLGYKALQAGLAAAPIGILPIILSPLIGKNAHHIDLRWLATMSFLIFAGCLFWRTQFNAEMDFGFVVWPQFIQGMGLAMFFMPLTAISLSSLPSDQIASASGLSNFMRLLAGSIGASVTTTVWDNREALHHTQFTANISAYHPNAVEQLQHLQALGMSNEQSAAYIVGMITREGAILAANELFWGMAWIYLGLIVLIWFAKPPFSSRGEGSAH
jgi:DHA2 family multidrug resistance protein